MAKKKNEKPNIKIGHGSALRLRQEWAFSGAVSNITGGFDMFELGSMRHLTREISKANFVDEYVRDLCGFFRLTESQAKVLKLMITDRYFLGDFKMNDEAMVNMADKTGLSPATIKECVWTLSSSKNLIKRKRLTMYSVNRDFLFNMAEIKNADFLSLHLTYKFKVDENHTVTTESGKEITLEHINGLLERYNEQETRKKQLLQMQELEKAHQDERAPGV